MCAEVATRWLVSWASCADVTAALWRFTTSVGVEQGNSTASEMTSVSQLQSWGFSFEKYSVPFEHVFTMSPLVSFSLNHKQMYDFYISPMIFPPTSNTTRQSTASSSAWLCGPCSEPDQPSLMCCFCRDGANPYLYLARPLQESSSWIHPLCMLAADPSSGTGRDANASCEWCKKSSSSADVDDASSFRLVSGGV